MIDAFMQKAGDNLSSQISGEGKEQWIESNSIPA